MRWDLERKLTAILCADVYGYSRLMGEDEEATLRTLTSHRKLIISQIAHHHGRFVNSAGDSVLAEFASVVNAVECALDIQSALKAENANLPRGRRMDFRIGVNLGDVMVEGEQIYGDGVNVAARLESLAEPGGIYISDTVHAQVRDKLGLGYEDRGEQAVKNIARPVHVWRVLLDEAAAAPRGPWRIPKRYWRGGALSLAGLAIIVGMIVLVQHLSLKPPQTHASIPPREKPALPLPDIPSIAVLPFTNLSGDPQQEYFSDGITDDLVTDLSRVPGLFVIDRGSTFAYKGKPTKVQQVGRELGVKYVLEGSARKEADQVRINVQLVDAGMGTQVWTHRYDKHLRDIFKVQDEIVQSLATTLNIQLRVLGKGYVMPQRTQNLEAYDYFLQGLEHLMTLTPEGFAKGRETLEKAIELDRGYADAYSGLSLSYLLGYIFEWDKDPTALDRAAELANEAIGLDDSAVVAYVVRGSVAANKGQREGAIADGQRAVSLDPNNAFIYLMLAENNFELDGQPEQELAYAQKAMRLDPHHPEPYWSHKGWAYARMGRYTEAVDALKQGEQGNPFVHVWLVCAYSELGREAEARTEAAQVLRVSPGFSLEEMRQRLPLIWQQRKRAQRCLAELREAGLK
jgi:adenylate cyclase